MSELLVYLSCLGTQLNRLICQKKKLLLDLFIH